METSNLVYHHPGQEQMQVEVILASRSDTGSPPLFTIRMRYPRPIHGEIMTHRVFSRNARSSRAVPVRTMLEEVSRIPYVPWHWLKNKPGMQGTEPLTPEEEEEAIEIWLQASHYAMEAVDQLFDPDGLNIHKQNPNRLLEPFSWIDTLITSSDWDNFLWLRQHGAAEPHLQDLANLVALAIENAEFQDLAKNEWHLPYITEDDWAAVAPMDDYNIPLLLKLSAARCARISYKPFNGDASLEAEFKRYELLVSDERVHASPLEHQACPDTTLDGNWNNPDLHGNLSGWIQHRKMVPNEVYRG